jgi:Sigma-70, region 4
LLQRQQHCRPRTWATPPVLAWLYTVAQRRFADEVRRRAHERPAALTAEPTVEYAPLVAGAINAALRRMQPEQQQVLTLKLVRGLRFADVGAELGVTPAAAKMRFVRALRALREELRFTFRLERLDGTPADPPSFKATVLVWQPGDPIHVRDDDADQAPTLIVQDVAERASSAEL